MLNPECAVHDRPHPFSVTNVLHTGEAAAVFTGWGGGVHKIPRHMTKHIYTTVGSSGFELAGG